MRWNDKVYNKHLTAKYNNILPKKHSRSLI